MEKRLLIRIGLLASLLVMTALAGSAIAGGTQSGFEPPAGAVISGPELWGVAMVYCNPAGSFATLRLKRVVDCNTETLTWINPTWIYANCPETAEAATNLEADFMQERLGAWFPPTGETPGTPYIETVKNFVREEDPATPGIYVISFDAMFKFYSQ